MRFMRRQRRVAIQFSSRRPFLIPSFMTSPPTAPNFSLGAARGLPRMTVPFGCYPSSAARRAALVPFALLSQPERQLGPRTRRRLYTRKGTACTDRRLTGPNPERLPALLRADMPSGPAGHPTEAVCVSASPPNPYRRRTLKTTARHSGRSLRTEKIYTRCFQDGTTRHRNAAAIGRLTGSISSSSHSGAEPATFGRSEKRETSSGR